MVEDFSGWTFEDVWDNQVPPGAFANNGQPPTEFEIHVGNTTRKVQALNWNHAQYRALTEAAEEAGGDLHRCELCGAHLRYAALFFDKQDALHVVGRECADRVQRGVTNREEWALVQAMKEAKSVSTKNGLRWKVDLQEPAGWRMVPYNERPAFVSMWTPKSGTGRFRRIGNPRLTVWATTEAELYDNVRALRSFLRSKNVNLAQPVKPRRRF